MLNINPTVLSKLANELCNPVIIFILFLITAKIFYFSGKEQKALIVFSLGVVWLLLVSGTPLSKYLVHRLENSYLPFQKSKQGYSKPVYIVVLNGGGIHRSTVPKEIQLYRHLSARLVEGIVIHKQLRGSTLMTSGNAFSLVSNIPNKNWVNLLELGAGVLDSTTSDFENTKAELNAYQRQIGNTGQLILVTSALHMPRAMLLCKKLGVSAISAPTDYLVYQNADELTTDPNTASYRMEMMEKVLHEYLGLVQVHFMD